MLTVAKRATYPQQWKSYNKAQVRETDELQRLLADLCSEIATAPR
jgi:hypothetical protein